MAIQTGAHSHESFIVRHYSKPAAILSLSCIKHHAHQHLPRSACLRIFFLCNHEIVVENLCNITIRTVVWGKENKYILFYSILNRYPVPLFRIRNRIGSVCFWPTRIRMQICNDLSRIRILPLTSKKIKINHDFYCFVTSQ